jgi:hypothetical protein
MRGYRGVLLGIAVVGCAGGCEQLAGIEDLELTPDASDATVGRGDGALPESSVPADGPIADSQGDAHVTDAAVDAGRDAVTDASGDSSAPVDAGEAGITYAEEVLMDSPLAYWRFNEDSGTVAVDSSGNGNDGTYVGNVLLGQIGAIANDSDTSVKFDGATSWMSAGDVFAFVDAGACSFEVWVKPLLDMSYHDVLSRTDGQGNTTTGYLMYIEPQPAPMMDFALYSAGTANIAESNVDIDGGTFTHMVGVYDGTMVYIYSDGVLQDSKPTSFPIPATSNPFTVAAQSGGLTSWFHGELDEVAVYGTALPLARIQAHYNVGIGLGP